MTKPEQAGLRAELVKYCENIGVYNASEDWGSQEAFDEFYNGLEQLFEATCLEVIEAGRVDGTFIEWNSLNLADIGLMKEALSRLLGRGEEG